MTFDLARKYSVKVYTIFSLKDNPSVVYSYFSCQNVYKKIKVHQQIRIPCLSHYRDKLGVTFGILCIQNASIFLNFGNIDITNRKQFTILKTSIYITKLSESFSVVTKEHTLRAVYQ
ncbi:hypothetical protein PHYBLDRAFT_68216 [Phycomyces blakesleeanus NRRL 1555(-)]|uniref:Uncharacterized protein n=1 Tax=Phycomyces blakesleeanus (strain ATCC 8743b / DSM 1359 / FGSC 10004 / NBRC 33097 / NRRL 1555) TaxID=763407 RepID=A0A167KDQ1_PHYB8|nr:hypothetical protein PHYBLDRAFT_68216 [Phycomyces blakesleeanus NRRL 1555(-)]OAD67849.1 hypothetical protein PHYBLDRAFT_68216 [Phycomyces blakesleeanus NRRL 1555(-)]|eukprot:XP_018285889.1 hypothetical protein PHYBLDRAFT_68216 [Phycomyces blakesleeanus NRRL 1555(-)]